MVMSWIWTGMVALSLAAALALRNGSALSAAIPKGAQAGLELAVSMAGSLCLWSGVGRLMEAAGVTAFLCRCFSPLLRRLFPSCQRDPVLTGYLSGNVCANFLGLGNAATPMGIQAAQRLARGRTVAGAELCRLVVLNTASIQLIPANVAAIRAQLGSSSPFDILPAVWLTSMASALLGLLAAFLLGRVCADA